MKSASKRDFFYKICSKGGVFFFIKFREFLCRNGYIPLKDDQQAQIRWWQWFCQLVWIQFSSDVIFSDLWINSGWACYNRKGSKTRAINSVLCERAHTFRHKKIGQTFFKKNNLKCIFWDYFYMLRHSWSIDIISTAEWCS